MGYQGLDTEEKPKETPDYEAESAGQSWYGFPQPL